MDEASWETTEITRERFPSICGEEFVFDVHTPDEYAEVMLFLESQGYQWAGGAHPTSHPSYAQNTKQIFCHEDCKLKKAISWNVLSDAPHYKLVDSMMTDVTFKNFLNGGD